MAHLFTYSICFYGVSSFMKSYCVIGCDISILVSTVYRRLPTGHLPTEPSAHRTSAHSKFYGRGHLPTKIFCFFIILHLPTRIFFNYITSAHKDFLFLIARWHLGAIKFIPGGSCFLSSKNFGPDIRFSMHDHAVL